MAEQRAIQGAAPHQTVNRRRRPYRRTVRSPEEQAAIDAAFRARFEVERQTWRFGTREGYARSGYPLLPCPRCNGIDLIGSDSDDSGHRIVCRTCKLEHHGAFCSDASENWNAGRIKPWLGEAAIFERGDEDGKQ